MDDYAEMTGDVPALVRGDALALPDLGGPGAELSTGLILTWRRSLVFTVEPSAVPLGAQGVPGVSAFAGVGGHLDPGEGWMQAVVREALEEAHCHISLGDSAVTYLCRQGAPPQPIAYRWHEAQRPLLVWVATFQLRRGPDRQRVPVTMVNAVFRAAAMNPPQPDAEIKSLLLLDQDLLLYTYARPRTVGDLLARGAQVIGEQLDPDVRLAPGGSAYFYAQWLAWQTDKEPENL